MWSFLTEYSGSMSSEFKTSSKDILHFTFRKSYCSSENKEKAENINIERIIAFFMTAPEAYSFKISKKRQENIRIKTLILIQLILDAIVKYKKLLVKEVSYENYANNMV